MNNNFSGSFVEGVKKRKRLATARTTEHCGEKQSTVMNIISTNVCELDETEKFNSRSFYQKTNKETKSPSKTELKICHFIKVIIV